MSMLGLSDESMPPEEIKIPKEKSPKLNKHMSQQSYEISKKAKELSLMKKEIENMKLNIEKALSYGSNERKPDFYTVLHQKVFHGIIIIINNNNK